MLWLICWAILLLFGPNSIQLEARCAPVSWRRNLFAQMNRCFLSAFIVLLSMCADFICRRFFATNGWDRRRDGMGDIEREWSHSFFRCSLCPKKVFLLALVYIYCCCYCSCLPAAYRLPLFRGESFSNFVVGSVLIAEEVHVYWGAEEGIRRGKKANWMEDAFARIFDTFFSLSAHPSSSYLFLPFVSTDEGGSDRLNFVRQETGATFTHSLVTPFVSTFWFAFDCVCAYDVSFWIGRRGMHRHESNVDGILMKLPGCWCLVTRWRIQSRINERKIPKRTETIGRLPT